MKRTPQLVLACAVIGMVIFPYLLIRSNFKRDQLQNALEESRAEIQRLDQALQVSSRIGANESDSLQSDRREAIKLRGEIVSLKQSLAAAEAAALKAATSTPNRNPNPAADLRVDPLPEDNPEVTVLKTKLISTTMESGQAIVLGGWESQPGKRAFVIIQPTRDPNTDQVSITSKWAEYSNNAANQLKFGSWPDSSGDQTSTMPKISFDHVLKELEKSEGIDLLSPPVVSTASGRQARISVTESRDTAQGAVEVGPKIDILPTVTDDGQIQLAIQASLTQQAPK